MTRDEHTARLEAELESIRRELETRNSGALEAFRHVIALKTADSVTFEAASALRRELEAVLIQISATKTHLANISWELRTQPHGT